MAPSDVSPWLGLLRTWSKKSVRRLSSFPPLGVPRCSRRRRQRSGSTNRVTKPAVSIAADDTEVCCFKPSWKNFTLSELQNATNNFSPSNIIGKGGYAEVYKGCLEDGQLVAVKRITRGSADERTKNFLHELGIAVHVNHPNTAKFIGAVVEGGMHLVFQLSPRGSLDNLLHGPKDKLDWAARYKIALGTCKGLEYLHDKCPRRIIHRDIKPANILVSEDFEPKIGDFGLAKWLPDKLTHRYVSSLDGTFGYVAPEYCSHGIVDEKTDVFAFGVVLLELITGREALNSVHQSLVTWAKPLLEENDIKNLADPFLGSFYVPKQMKWMAQTAHMCIQHSATLRPRMSQVLKLLEGQEGQLEMTKVLQIKTVLLSRTYYEELFNAAAEEEEEEEYDATDI